MGLLPRGKYVRFHYLWLRGRQGQSLCSAGLPALCGFPSFPLLSGLFMGQGSTGMMGKKHGPYLFLKNCPASSTVYMNSGAWIMDQREKNYMLDSPAFSYSVVFISLGRAHFPKQLQLSIKNTLTLRLFSSRLLHWEARSFIVFLFSLKDFAFCIPILEENYSPRWLTVNLYQACVSNLPTNFWGLGMVLSAPVRIWKHTPSQFSKATLPVRDICF